VSEKAPLQDQLSKGVRARRSCIEQQGCKRIAEMCEQPAILKRKMDIGKIAITSCPTLGDSWNNGTEAFTALHLSRWLFLLRRLGMKRTACAC
jgi:hypothetical protein